jgi:gamma-glutamylcyclotransferase (GGCT)/AIG2-like uncharacterized protein YtfP
VFVYGTLKRGECREKCWPIPPREVVPATVLGLLYDLAPYPGLVAGRHRVAGEAWHFAEADMPVTLAALDDIEGAYGRDGDEYHRDVVLCSTATGDLYAWAYFYQRVHELHSAKPIWPNAEGFCCWTGAGQRYFA